MKKKKIIWLVIAVILILGLSMLLAYKEKLLPTSGYIYALKPFPTRIPVVSGPMCGWCGNTCVSWKIVDARRARCADVMPAPGAECVSENGVCVLKAGNFQTE